MRLDRVLDLREQQVADCCVLQGKLCFHLSDIQKCFRNGPVHDFHGLKDNQMSKVRASSHEYPHVEKIKNLREQNFEGEANNKQSDSEDTQRSDFSN